MDVGPYAAELEFFTKQGLTSSSSTGSLYPVTVPGTVDGWWTILEACGTMTLGDVLKCCRSIFQNQRLGVEI